MIWVLYVKIMTEILSGLKDINLLILGSSIAKSVSVGYSSVIY